MAWLWRRKDSDAAPSRPEAAPAPSTDHDVIRQEQAPTGDWMTLPPMATNGPIPTTFRVQTLPEILATHQSPRLSGSLGHAVSPQAPSGIVSGLAMEAASVRPAAESGTDLPLRAPHAAPVEDAAVSVERPVQERSLPAVQPEPLSVSTLPEPVVSRSLAGPLPLVSPVTGARDLPLARAVDAPLPSTPAPEAPSERAAEDAPSSSPDAPLGPYDLGFGGFDRSALEEAPQQGDPELFSPPPGDLAPPIQPRTLQRRLAGARPIEVPPQLPLSSTATNPPPATSTPTDLPLVNPASPGARSAPDQPARGISAQRSEDVAGGHPGDQPSPDQSGMPVQEFEGTEQTAPLASEQDPITAQRSADTTTATGETARAEPSTAALPLHTASRLPDRDVESDRTVPEETQGAALSAQRSEDTEEETAPLASEQGPITAQRSADTTTATDETARAEPPTAALPLHTAARSPEPDAGSASAQPASERSGISAQRTEDTERSEETAPLASEQGPITAQRSADTTTATGESARAESTTAALPLHTASRSPEAGVGSASDQPASERSVTSAQRTEETGTEETATEDTVAPTISPLSTTASPEQLTSAGSTSREQIGASPASLPLAPPDWQETLDAPSASAAAGSPPANGPSASAPALQLQPEAAVTRPAGAGGSPTALTLAGSRAVGAQKPLSSLAPLMPSTTSAIQRSVAAAAAPAPATTLMRPRPAAGPNADHGMSSPVTADLPEMVTSGALAATSPVAPLVHPQDRRAPSDEGPVTAFPLQRATNTPSATGGSAALPLHTPAAAIPSAADIAVTAGLAERGPDGSLHYRQPPTGAESVQQAFVVQREGESDVSAPSTSPDPASTAVGAQTISVSPTPGAPDATAQEKAQALAEQARTLWPHIRHQLESDIRLQLEARNRASGAR